MLTSTSNLNNKCLQLTEDVRQLPFFHNGSILGVSYNADLATASSLLLREFPYIHRQSSELISLDEDISDPPKRLENS